MLDPAIVTFFDERKAGWLKKKLKSDMTAAEVDEIKLECERIYSVEKWLPDAAKRAGQMSISTHPCTFSHPSARKNKNGYVTSVIADNVANAADGLLRTGNVVSGKDALGNAAALDVYKFLSIVIADGKSVIEHIFQNTEISRSLLDVKTESYDKLRNGFMAMVSNDDTLITSSKIKQVYFPEADGYHQLSVLSNSGIMYELRNRIDALRFSDVVKDGREARRKNAYSDTGYSEIYDITIIGYGGTKPQNISVLNNQYGGRACLLSSVPPFLKRHNIKFPTKDFFSQNLRYYECKNILRRLDNTLKIDRDGLVPLDKIRKGRDRCLGDIMDVIIQKMIAARSVSFKEFYPKNSRLPVWQQVWLCEQNAEKRLEQDDWLDTLCEHIVRWILAAYKNTVKNPVLLGEAERQYIIGFIDGNTEVLR